MSFHSHLLRDRDTHRPRSVYRSSGTYPSVPLSQSIASPTAGGPIDNSNEMCPDFTLAKGRCAVPMSMRRFECILPLLRKKTNKQKTSCTVMLVKTNKKWAKKKRKKKGGQKESCKCIMANTSAIWQQVAHSTYQLPSPGCSAGAVQ